MYMHVYTAMCMDINSFSAEVKLEVQTSNGVSFNFFFFKIHPGTAELKSNELKSSSISIYFYLLGDQKFFSKLPALLASTEDIAAIRHPCNSLGYASSSFSTLVASIDAGV